MSTVPVCIPASPGANAGDVRDAGSIPGSGRSPGEGNGTPLQYSCLENPMDQGSLVGYSSWGRKELDSTEAIKLGHPPVCMVFLTSIISLLFSVSLRFFPEVLSCFVWNVFLGCFILLDTVLLSMHQTPQSPLPVLLGLPCVVAESFIVRAALALHCFSISLWVKWSFTFNSSQWLRVCQDQPVPKERTYILGPHRTVIIRDTVLGRVPPQDTTLMADWNASPGFLRKSLFSLFRSLGLKDGLLLWLADMGLQRCSWGNGDPWVQSAFSLCLALAHQYLPKRNLYPYLGPDFCECCWQILLSPGSAGQGGFCSRSPTTGIKEKESVNLYHPWGMVRGNRPRSLVFLWERPISLSS